MILCVLFVLKNVRETTKTQWPWEDRHFFSPICLSNAFWLCWCCALFCSVGFDQSETSIGGGDRDPVTLCLGSGGHVACCGFTRATSRQTALAYFHFPSALLHVALQTDHPVTPTLWANPLAVPLTQDSDDILYLEVWCVMFWNGWRHLSNSHIPLLICVLKQSFVKIATRCVM